MKVTKEWLIETISKIPDSTEMEITGHDWSLFRKLDPNYKEPEPWLTKRKEVLERDSK